MPPNNSHSCKPGSETYSSVCMSRHQQLGIAHQSINSPSQCTLASLKLRHHTNQQFYILQVIEEGKIAICIITDAVVFSQSAMVDLLTYITVKLLHRYLRHSGIIYPNIHITTCAQYLRKMATHEVCFSKEQSLLLKSEATPR